MFSYDSVAGSRPIGGDRRPRQQMQYTGYNPMQQPRRQYGTAAQVGGDEAYNAFLAQPPGYGQQRAAFNDRYASSLFSAQNQNKPGMGLMTDQQAAQMGGGRFMPNVTVGGAYGRGPAGQDNSYLYKLLGIDGQGHAVPGGVTDPTALGALRSRMKAPWMNGQQQMAQAGNPAAALGMDTTGTDPSTIAARQARAAASGGRLEFNPATGQNRGNYSMSPGIGGIDAQALVRQNPNAIYGFSAENQKKLAMDPGYQQDLKGRQLAYQIRQQQAQGDHAQRQDMVQQNAMARTGARQDRMNGVSPQFRMQHELQQQHLQNQNDMLAAQLGIQNRRLDQGDNELAQKDNQFKQQLRAQVAVKAAESGMDEDQTEELMNRLGMGGGGNAQVVPGGKGKLAQKDRKQFEELAKEDDPAVTARHLSAMVDEGKMTQEEADKKLNELHPQGTLGWMLGYDPTRTTDDAGGWNNWWAGKQVDPKSGKRWKGSTMSEFFKNTPPWAPFTGQK